MARIKKTTSEWTDQMMYFGEEAFITSENTIDRSDINAPKGALVAPTRVIIKIKRIRETSLFGQSYVDMTVKLETHIHSKVFGHDIDTILKEDVYDGRVYPSDDVTVAGLLQRVYIDVD